MRWLRPGPAAERESGMSTVEVVLLAPMIIIVLMVLASLAEFVNAKGVVASAASDAARMGSLQRSSGTAASAAQTVATGDLHGSVYCQNGTGGVPVLNPAPTGFVRGGIYTVTITCKVNYFGLSMLLTSVGASPVDLYRETN